MTEAELLANPPADAEGPLLFFRSKDDDNPELRIRGWEMSEKVGAALHPGTELPAFQSGVYEMPNETYHADPVPGGSLSQSGAKLLLPPNCPALFNYEQTHPRPPKDAYDFGHAAHHLILGSGPELAEVKADNWMTKAAKEQKAAAYSIGAVPMLSKDLETVHAMAAAIREHELAMALFSDGLPEQSLFYRDPDSGVILRGRLDWLPNATADRMIIPDYKTAISAAPEKFQRSLHEYGYHQQAPWYLDLVLGLGLAESASFVFVVQEKTAPYLVSVFEPDPVAIRIGRYLNRQAIELYAKCKRENHWPAYTDGVEQLPLPVYYERKFEDVA